MSTSSPSVAVVFCAHHKPWLMMSTLVTTLLQDASVTDLYIAYNLGDGVCPDKASYQEYHRLAREWGLDPQISPYDARVREICQLRGIAVHEIEFENDTSLDSGAWYKFFRTGLWRRHDYLLFLGEGTLLARGTTLSAMLSLARMRGAHFIASGHEKRRFPRGDMERYYARSRDVASPMLEFHDDMIRRTFEVFCRDPSFREIYQQWPLQGPSITENHVPDIWPRRTVSRRLFAAINDRHRAGAGPRALVRRSLAAARPALHEVDGTLAAVDVRRGSGRTAPRSRTEPSVPRIHVNGVLQPMAGVVEPVNVDGVNFHTAEEPEWFCCAVNHFFSREFLEQLTAKLEAYDMYELLDIPYCATALEVIWGLMPRWLGVDKWFTDGIHRVRKNFVTGRREDDAATMAWYINRYHRGAVRVAADGDFLKLKSWHPSLDRVAAHLNDYYF